MLSLLPSPRFPTSAWALHVVEPLSLGEVASKAQGIVVAAPTDQGCIVVAASTAAAGQTAEATIVAAPTEQRSTEQLLVAEVALVLVETRVPSSQKQAREQQHNWANVRSGNKSVLDDNKHSKYLEFTFLGGLLNICPDLLLVALDPSRSSVPCRSE